MGRPSKYNPERVAKIVEAIGKGCKVEAAAAAGGISKETFYAWAREYPQFSDAVKAARQEQQAELLDIIREHAPKTWQAAAWLLERIHMYRNNLDINAKVEGKVEQKHDLSKLSAEQLAQLVALLEMTDEQD